MIKINKYIPFKESVKIQKESSVLLLLEWNHYLAKDVLTGKIFEYIGAKRPILAIGYKYGAINKII
ncbi:MAG: hypothetical protein M1308_09205, partial [Actinobacteria bacterium]|nr:hypothetical protein [Actinomycetota bacterium]